MTRRLVTSVVLVAVWLLMLLAGYSLGGGAHLLLAAGAIVFPWRLDGPEA